MVKRRATSSRKDRQSFEDNPFLESFLEWNGSPEGQQSTEALDLMFDTLGQVDVDARRSKIVWTDGQRLSIEQIVERIHAEQRHLTIR